MTSFAGTTSTSLTARRRSATRTCWWREVRRSQERSQPIRSSSPSAPAPPPGAPADGAVVLTSDDVACLKALPRVLIVVGGSVIGIEYASMFAALGVQVTLIDRRERPLEFLDREIVEELMHQMRDRNVVFRLGEAVASLEIADGQPRRAVIHLESGK